MAIIIKLRPKIDAPVGYQAHKALRPITWPHFTPGTPVRIVAKSKPSFYAWKLGDTGIVRKVCQACGMRDKHPQDDLYFVELDLPRVASKEIVYLTYNQLASQ